jgi:UDP-N-acetylmuramate dehydrogenase
MVLQENVPLAPLTTFRIGGPARYFLEARTSTEVAEAVTFAKSSNLGLFVLGGGSNLLVSDEGWPGLVLKVAVGGIDRRDEGKGVILFDVGAGESWDGFVSQAVAGDCAGVECLSGIPGTVGGTPVQNVGAYGQEVSQTIDSVQVFDLEHRQIRELCNEACGFSYRTSIFNTTERGRFIVMRVTYALLPGGEPRTEYADLRRHFEGRALGPSLAEVRETVLQIRGRKGMLIVEGDPDCRSAGSFFKNPVLSEEQLQGAEKRAEARSLVIPTYPALAQSHKVSAAWLVEHSGFSRGYSFGQVGISSKHALAIVNRGGASAAEILALKQQIQEKVQAVWGVYLEPEPVFVGI